MTGRPVRQAAVVKLSAADRDVLARAYVTPHAARRFSAKIRRCDGVRAVGSITVGIRERATAVRDRHPDRDGDGPSRVDVDVEGDPRFVARIVADPDHGGLVVETILVHPDDWQSWPEPATTAAAGWWLSLVRLDRDHKWIRDACGDVCVMHRRVLDLAEAHPADTAGRLLWAQPEPGLLVVRSTRPVTASPPGMATSVNHRPWLPPDQPGRYRIGAVVNAARRRKKTVIDVVDTDDGMAEWLTGRVHGQVTDVSIVRAWTQSGVHHHRNRVTVHYSLIDAVVDVADVPATVDAVAGGIGRGKAWGAGLTWWDRA